MLEYTVRRDKKNLSDQEEQKTQQNTLATTSNETKPDKSATRKDDELGKAEDTATPDVPVIYVDEVWCFQYYL